MFNPKVLARSIALAGSLSLLVGPSVFAQNRPWQGTDQRVADRGVSNRMVEGTVQSVFRDRNGERVRLTNGMDVFVPNGVANMNQGRRVQAYGLQAGDVVRIDVYSRQGDGRDAQARSLEVLRSNSQNNNYYNNDRRMNGTVISLDRRNNMMVLQADNGRTVNVDLGAHRRMMGNFRRGERVSVSGRMDRGTFVADDVRMEANVR